MEQSSTVDGRALFSTSTKTDDGSQSQKAAASSTIGKSSPPPPPGGQAADVKILGTLASYLWMKDNLEFRVRIVAALGLLVGAKVSGLVGYCSWFVVNLQMLISDPCLWLYMFFFFLFSDFECSGAFLVQACR